jgi:hypothetical protein
VDGEVVHLVQPAAGVVDEDAERARRAHERDGGDGDRAERPTRAPGGAPTRPGR